MSPADAYPYTNGEVIKQNWSPIFIFFAFAVSFTASYSAVRVLDHDLWRTEKEKDHASAIIIKYPKAVAAVLLGFGTVWSMHFVGMAAVSLDRVPMCYDWPVTVGSLVSSIIFVWLGVIIAKQDVFQCKDRLDKLKKIIVSRKHVTVKGQHKKAERTIHLVAFFYKPWYILLGATTAAAGALTMHYIGMLAVQGSFQKIWSIPYVSASVILGIIICNVGFLILFRLLLWKVEKFWLRPASAFVIAIAVCTLHFFGMLGVTYKFDESLVGACKGRPGYMNSQVWTTHQILALAIGIVVPSLALLIENLICREVFHAYAKLKNPALTVSFILEAGTKSRNTNVRRASIIAQKEMQRLSATSNGMPSRLSAASYEMPSRLSAASYEMPSRLSAASNGMPSMLSATSNGMEQAAAAVAVADAAAGMSLEMEFLPISRSSAPCTCACGCHSRDTHRRVSFNTDLLPAAAQDEADQAVAKRGKDYSGSFLRPAIKESSESKNILAEASNRSAESEESLIELATQIKPEASNRSAESEESLIELATQINQATEKRPDSLTLVNVTEDAKVALSLPASFENSSERLLDSTSDSSRAAALEEGVSYKWEEAKHGKEYSGSFLRPAIKESPESKNIIAEASNRSAESEESLIELATQIKQATEKRPNSLTLVYVTEDAKVALSLPASFENSSERLSDSTSDSSRAAALEEGASYKWENDQHQPDL